MRDLLLTVILSGGLIWSLLNPRIAIFFLTWVTFQRPQDFSWGFWNNQPLYLVTLMVTVFSVIVHRQIQPRLPPALLIYLLLLTFMTFSTALSVYPGTWGFYRSYIAPMWVMPLLYFMTINNLQMLKWVIWIAAGSICLNAFKTGLSLTLSGGAHLTDQISGFVGDNNVFGLVVCVAVAILMGLRSTLPPKRWISIAIYVVVAFAFLCIVYTKSRGAMLTVMVVSLTAALLSNKPVRNLFVVSALAAVAYWAIPPEYFDRLETVRDFRADASAMGRIQNWALAWDAALDNPIFGVGPENHIPYNQSKVVDVQVRVAHSVYFQVLGELGFPALILYVAFALTGAASLAHTWKFAGRAVAQRPDLAWVRDLAFWMFCGWVGYLFGSGLLNMLYIEFPWYVVFFASMLRLHLDTELRGKSSKLDLKKAQVAPRRSAGARAGRSSPVQSLVNSRSPRGTL